MSGVASTQAPPISARYKKLEKIGEGTYGKVYLAEDLQTGERVALKKMHFDDAEGIPSTALREVALLRELSGHPNVVALNDVIYSNRTLYLVFEFADQDLKQHMDSKGQLSANDVRKFSFQLLYGVSYIHTRRILHRDLKPQNVLVTANGMVKLADFGLGRAFSIPLRAYTHEVVTLWYRAPEILLGQDAYSVPIDIWSLGCIFTEMLTGKALFPGDSEIDQLFRIFRVLGTPTEATWRGVTQLPAFQPIFPTYRPQSVRSHFDQLARRHADAFDLIESMLRYDPERRITAHACLSHRFFDDAKSVHELQRMYEGK